MATNRGGDKEYWKTRYRRNPDDQRNRSYKHLYGISLDDYNDMYSKQDGRCAICGRSYPRLSVDHDHKSNKVRGLLCNSCNMTLGVLEKHAEQINKYRAGLV